MPPLRGLCHLLWDHSTNMARLRRSTAAKIEAKQILSLRERKEQPWPPIGNLYERIIREITSGQRAASVTVSTRCAPPAARITPTAKSTLVPLLARLSRPSTCLTEFTSYLPTR